MKVTVCQLRDEPEFLNLDWKALVKHVQNNKSELVVLPEMPFYPWMARTKKCKGAHGEYAIGNTKLTAKVIAITTITILRIIFLRDLIMKFFLRLVFIK